MCYQNIISPVLIGEFVEMDRALYAPCMPRIGKKSRRDSRAKVLSATPIKIKS